MARAGKGATRNGRDGAPSSSQQQKEKGGILIGAKVEQDEKQ